MYGMKQSDVKITKTELKKGVDAIKATKASKSDQMKQLFGLGLDIKQIAEIMNVRYNFVYNVISNYVRVNDVKVEQTKKISRKDDIIKLYKNGKTRVEISKTLKCNYNYVFKVTKDYEAEEKAK
jgi:transposase-like protein